MHLTLSALKMSHHTLPLLFLNLGGEMVYILDQRLRAQHIEKDKSFKVLADISGLMLNERFVSELFRPQPVGPPAALRSLFRDIAHSSIMRLDDASMGKMWDLMTMAVKLQVLRAVAPRDLVLGTLNHLDGIRCLAGPAVERLAERAHVLVVKKYGNMASGDLQSARCCMLNFLQGLEVRVSLFLRLGFQDSDGRLLRPTGGPVPSGCEVPGTIRVLDGRGAEDDAVVLVSRFPVVGDFRSAGDAGSLELHGYRGTDLGCNLYQTSDPMQVEGSGWSGGPGGVGCRECAPPGSCGPLGALGARAGLRVGREELNMLLAQLVGSRPAPRDVPASVVRVSLFARPDQSDADAPAETPARDRDDAVLSFDASGSAGSRSARLQAVLSDLDLDLDLDLDSAAAAPAGSSSWGHGDLLDLLGDLGDGGDG